MTPKQSQAALKLVAHDVEILSPWANVATRPLFGAVSLRRQGRVFAMIWDDSLYLKVDADSRHDYEKAGSTPLAYRSRGEERALTSYWEVPPEVIEDEERLISWAERAFCAASRP